ncbi:hypothetical protein [Candidatus Poriferisocius sp.]|uniref:hypothetical protein n=1 Tax=Candidatus Poriferisocius sp. TaxID=3101276 RepID=UPI003B011A72
MSFRPPEILTITLLPFVLIWPAVLTVEPRKEKAKMPVMIEFQFTLEVVGPSGQDDDFAEWVAAHSGAAGHVSRDERHYIHFAQSADSLDDAVRDAVDALNGWEGLDILSFQAACSNTGVLARA